MAMRLTRFVAKAEKGSGWRVWDRMQHRFWGPVFSRQPRAVIAELNGGKRGPKLDALVASARAGNGKA
jgi:hypothetical protein